MNAREIVSKLKGRWFASYGLIRCPAHPDENPSCRISDGESALLVRCYAGCEPSAILAGLRALNCGDDYQPTERTAEEIEAERQERIRKGERARAIFARAVDPAGTLVERCWRARGLRIPIPASLRFHPACPHPTESLAPAMVAAVVTWPDDKPSGIHRTFIDSVTARKIEHATDKAMFGNINGGAVRLAEAAEEIGVAEGIESGASAMQLHGVPTWAALSTEHLKALILPPCVRRVIIFADNDLQARRKDGTPRLNDEGQPYYPGLEAARAAALRWTIEGRKVQIAMPPAPGTDWNDALSGAEMINA